MQHPNTAVQADAAGAALTWARFTRKLRSAIIDFGSAALPLHRLTRRGVARSIGRRLAVCWGVTITCGSLEANREIRGYNPRPGAVGC
jgi:hypothetical protein